MAIFDNLHEIAALADGKAIGAPIIDDEEIDLDQHAEQSGEPTIAMGEFEIGEQPRAIGPQIATVLGTEVFYRDFSNRRSVASYLGLTPSPFQSGDMARTLGITKAGNPRARTAMIELA